VTAEEFEGVHARTARPLRAYLVRVGGDPALADDLLQETYYRLLTMDARKRAAAPERPLLFRIAAHALYDHFRRRRREERHAAAWRPPPVGAPPGQDADLARVLAEIRPRERSLLWLAYVEGLTHAEIASALGLRPGSVRVLLFRARRALAERLRARGIGREVGS